MTLPEVLIAVAILTIGQKIEELRNQAFVATLAAMSDTPEAGVTRTWQIAQVGATVVPNRLARITVTVNWTSGTRGTGQQVIVETMRAE